MGRDRRQRDDAPPQSQGSAWRPRSTTTRSRRNEQEAAAAAQPPTAAEPGPAGPPAAAGALTPEGMERLKQLGELHEQEVLTDEEFEREKAKLLGAG